MSNIKKQYQEIFEFLSTNSGKKVSTVLPELTEMMSRKSSGGIDGKTFIRDEEGNVTHIYCYYHKLWEDVTVAEYGKKYSSATGLNTMCKEGVSAWTKQQRVKKASEVKLLTKVGSGEIMPEEIADHQAKIQEVSQEIVPRADGHGTDTV